LISLIRHDAAAHAHLYAIRADLAGLTPARAY